MKLLDIVPVTAPGLISKEMEEYINKYLSKDTVMDITQLRIAAVLSGKPGVCSRPAHALRMALRRSSAWNSMG